MSEIKLVVLDLAGTTVDDSIDGVPLVIASFKEAFARAGISLTAEQINPHRGKEKREACAALYRAHGPQKLSRMEEEQAITKIYSGFEAALEDTMGRIDKEIPGTTEVLRWLHQNKIKVALGSGFPHKVTERLIDKMGWRKEGLVDYVGSAESVGKGRPHPALVLDAMGKLRIQHKKQVLKVGDTIMDVEEGKNAGVRTAAVLTGTQSRTALSKSLPDSIIESVRDLPDLIERSKKAAL